MAGKKKAETIEQAPAAKQPGTAVLDIRAELKKKAQEIAGRLGAAGGDSIRTTQDKHFVMPDGTKDNKPLRMVILDFVSVNAFFDRPYKKGEESPPACFAIGENAKGLIPSKSSPDLQSETGCDTCPNNEFGSNGAGKACSNTRLLALVEDSDTPDSPILMLKVSATAIKGFDAYVKGIQAQFDTTPLGVVTEIYFDPNSTYGSLRFGNPAPNPNFEKHYERLGAAKARLLSEPDVSQYKPPAPVKGAAKRR